MGAECRTLGASFTTNTPRQAGRTLPTNEQRKRLIEAVTKAETSYVLAKAAATRAGTPQPVRHKCFITYHGADIDAVTTFVDDFADVFIPRVIGVSESDNFNDPITSQDEDYIKSQIGSKYLSDSTVTILFVGQCTWSRKFVDWELSSSLKDGTVNKRNGLMAITPPDRSTNTLPSRFSDNLKESDKYARYYYYPKTTSELRSWIQAAFDARTTRSHLIDNSRGLRKINSPCT
jgi:hypothetical protein